MTNVELVIGGVTYDFEIERYRPTTREDTGEVHIGVCRRWLGSVSTVKWEVVSFGTVCERYREHHDSATMAEASNALHDEILATLEWRHR